MDIDKIEFENYKCFSKVEIENIQNLNIIIGKNNIGKSSILDIIEMIYDVEKLKKRQDTRIYLEKKIDEMSLEKSFSKTTSGGDIPGNHFNFAKKYLDIPFRFELSVNNNRKTHHIYPNLNEYNAIYESKFNNRWSNLAKNISYKSKTVKRMTAERDVYPEEDSESMQVMSNGTGVTRIISNFLNKDKYDENIVRDELLTKLNEIMGEDGEFLEIVSQQVGDGSNLKWEIFLREDSKGRVPLSASGSGLKTILTVLVFTILVPVVEKKGLDEYIFMFEEIENNLHPSIQRRLLNYIETLSRNSTIFLTTHSNVLLDAFQNSEKTNIMHVKKMENEIKLYNASDGVLKNDILEDLGIRASDLLQSNGIIWVEGPSDRIYVNKWIELWSNGSIKEGREYQCLFYGGRLLSHLAFIDEYFSDFINLMKINRNSIILIDSDKKEENEEINETKKRVQLEAQESKIMSWITNGREIENYIPIKTIYDYLGENYREESFNMYDNISDLLNKIKAQEGIKFERNKVKFARGISDLLDIDSLYGVLDLDEKMKEVIIHIKKWNNIN